MNLKRKMPIIFARGQSFFLSLPHLVQWLLAALAIGSQIALAYVQVCHYQNQQADRLAQLSHARVYTQSVWVLGVWRLEFLARTRRDDAA